MANLVIIPARGGSKRIPKKNIKEFNGRPIIAYTIQAAIDSGLFDEIMVSTDDAEIAAVAKANGANIPFMRSEANSNDFATLVDVLLEVVSNYKEAGKTFDRICCILPTAALISQQRLAEGCETLNAQQYSSVIPVIRFAYPIQRALANNNGFLHMREPEHLKSRSQDLEPYFHDSGQFYWITTEALFHEKTIFTSKAGFIELKETEAQDVDTLLDWEMLNVKYNYLTRSEAGKPGA